MNFKQSVKPITYLKNHTAELVREVSEGKSVMNSQSSEAMALLKLLAFGESDLSAGRTISQEEAFERASRVIRRARDE